MQNIYYGKFYIQISLNKRIVKVSIKWDRLNRVYLNFKKRGILGVYFN